jgi:hypothetical protein
VFDHQSAFLKHLILSLPISLFQYFAQLLGHSLGMKHDFIEPLSIPKGIIYDSNGDSCTDIYGVMDNKPLVQKWSKCSVESFTEYYNEVVTSQGKFCMDPPGNGNFHRIHC